MSKGTAWEAQPRHPTEALCCGVAICFMNTQARTWCNALEKSLRVEPTQCNVYGKEQCGTVKRQVVNPGLHVAKMPLIVPAHGGILPQLSSQSVWLSYHWLMTQAHFRPLHFRPSSFVNWFNLAFSVTVLHFIPAVSVRLHPLKIWRVSPPAHLITLAHDS